MLLLDHDMMLNIFAGLNKRTTTTEKLREKAAEFGEVVYGVFCG